MAEQVGRKLAAILVSDVVGYSRLAGRDEELTLARLRALRSDLIDPIIAVHRGRVVKRTGDGALVEFRSVVDAVRCAIEVQTGLVERNSGLPPERKIEFRIGIHLGDVMEEADGDLMGDGVNIAARLETICEPGGVALSEDAYRQVRNRLDLAVTDLGDQTLKNIAEPVRVYALTVGQPATARAAPQTYPSPPHSSFPSPPSGGEGRVRGAAPSQPTSPSHRSAMGPSLSPLKGGEGKRRPAIAIAAAVAALIVIAAAAGWYFLARPGANIAANAPAHLSIVVLPFTNLSGDPKQDYFADGITDNLTTDLLRIRNSFVIARNTAFTFKGKNVDAKEIGKDLGVRYVLEGSVQRDGNRVRVNAQLIDAESGSHLWADRFEEDLADLFKLQDDVVARLANTLGYELVKAEAKRSEHSTNPDVIDLTMRGWALENLPPQKDTNETALGFFEQALEIDHNNADALAGAATAYMRNYVYGWRGPSTDYDLKIIVPADRAIARDIYGVKAYYAKGLYLANSQRAGDGLATVETGIQNNPNIAQLYFLRGFIESHLGRNESALSDLRQALRLSPRDPQNGIWLTMVGDAELELGQESASIDSERRAVEEGYRTFFPYAHLAAAYALTNKMEDAKAALAEALRLKPDLSIKSLLRQKPGSPRFYEGLRLAGLREDEPPKHLSIVVLPFDNLSGDPKQDYFADGITDNLTTDLSRIRNSFVIARNTAFIYKGKAVDAKQIGKELGVRYVLEGSVARDGNRVRVNAQLIDAESGSHLWADRFEEDLADLFKLQDDVVARLANTLGYELVKAEAATAAHSTNPDAIDLTMQGWAILNVAGRDKERHQRARELFERALAADPQDAGAMVGVALIDERAWAYGWGERSDDKLAGAIDRVTRALTINPDYAIGYYVKSQGLFFANRFPEGVEAGRTGTMVDPNSAFDYFAMAQSEWPLGLCQQTIDHVKKAFELSPRDPGAGVWHMNLGIGEICLGHIDAAVAEFKRTIDSGFRAYVAYSNLAAAEALSGNSVEAQEALAEARRLNPNLTLKWLGAHSPSQPTIAQGLRKAGLPEDEAPKHLSIVVLPFANLSNDPKQDYFADGITDNLTTDLSRIRNSFVIARNTAFTYKGKAVDAKEIGKELGVRYVLEGSVQRDGNRVRVNAQLIDAESGSHLWADRFEEDLADLFKLQDDVVARLANSLGYELVKAEAERASHSTNPDAIDLVMRGQALMFQSPGKDTNLTARRLFEAALKLDPDNDDAQVGEARTYEFEFINGWAKTTSRTDFDAKVLPPVDRAIAANSANMQAYLTKTYYLFLSDRAGEALATANAGLAVNPNFAPLYIARRGAELTLGRLNDALSDVQRAMQLSPRDEQTPQWHFQAGAVQLGLGNYDAAIAEENKSIESGYRAFQPYTYLAAANALTDKMDEAKANLAEAVRINPKLTIKWAETHSPNQTRYFDGLRKAGLREDEGPRLSIVVLPFENLSGDAKQDYLADVLTDELTTYISRIPGSFVIARNTAFTYKGKPTDVKEIGKELGVRYALEGSVQPTDKRIRTNAQLIDTETGAHLWAEEFDTDKTDLLQTEDQIVTRLARTLQIQLTDIETAKLQRAHPDNPDAQELALRCQTSLWKTGPLGRGAEAAYRLCEQALALDPNDVIALAAMSSRFSLRVGGAQSTDREGDLKRADELASRALAIDPNSPEAHHAKSLALMLSQHFDEAQEEAQRAIALSPAFMDGRGDLCGAIYGAGEPDKLIACVDEFSRLSPHDPLLWGAAIFKGAAYLMQGKNDQALAAFRRTVALNPNYPLAEAYVAATLALLGKNAEAREALARYLSMPGTRTKTIAAFKKQNYSDNPIYLAMRERVYQGLRKAGMAEQ